MLSTVVVSWLALAGPSEKLLSDPDAMAHFEAAQAAFNEGDYAEASAELEKAFLIEPADALLYPWAQAERFRGRCEVAVDLYRKFLDTEPSENFQIAAEENLERCEADLAERETDDEPVPLAVLDDGWDQVTDRDPPPPADAAPPRRDKPWIADPLGGVLTGVGLAGVATGAALVGVAASNAKNVGGAPTNDEYLDERQKATALRNGGVVALSLGGALLVGGIVRYAIVGTRGGTRGAGAKKRSAGAWMGPGRSAGVVFSRRF